MNDTSTTWLVGRIRSGDQRAFAELVRRHEPTLLRCARGLLGPGGPDEDVVQDAFLKLARTPPRLSPEAPDLEHAKLARWLLQVTRNQCMDWLRAERRRRAREARCAVPELTAGGFDALDARDATDVAESLLSALPDDERDVLVLRLLGDKSYREIADLTDRAVGTVGWLVSQGLRRLSGQLAAALGEEVDPRLARRDA